MTDKQKCCPHLSLYFGSGYFYVFCSECHMKWVATKAENPPEFDYEAGVVPIGHVEANEPRSIKPKETP